MKGFTLIETLVYLALFAIIIGGSLTAVYAMIESQDHNTAAAQVQEEGAYLMGKVDHALSRARAVVAPSENGGALTVALADGTTETIALDGRNVTLRRGTVSPVRLNNDNVSITALVFTHVHTDGVGAHPESVEAQMTIVATTSSGRVLSREFSTVRYLRK